MKIYFSAAISAKEELGSNYSMIVNELEKMGHVVLSRQIVNKTLDTIESNSPQEHEEYYRWMMKQINDADLMVAEVSFPSTVNIGHELTLALEKEKPVLALYVKDRKPVLFWGITSDRFYSAEYSKDNLHDVLNDSISYLSEQQDTRFNFFISPRIGHYLDLVSKKRRLPRAVYLRKLIEEDMKKNRDFEE